MSRAQRLGDFLEKKCGWSVWNNDATNTKCMCGIMIETPYCPQCGRKNDNIEANTLAQLEAAIKFALEEN